MNFQKRTILILIILGLLLSVFLFLGIHPLLVKIQKSSFEIDKIKTDFFYLQKKHEIIELMKQKYHQESLLTDIEKINSMLINAEAPVDFIKFLERSALKSRVLLETTPFLVRTAEKDPWNSIGFQLTVYSDFVNFFEFLNAIEKSPFLVEIQSLNIRKAAEKDKKEEGVVAMVLIKVFSK